MLAVLLVAGWRLASASAAVAASGGWRHLRVCHVGSAVRVGPTLTRHGISYVDDACLTRLLQGSPGVVDLDLSGTRVTPAGLTHLVTAVRDRFSSSSSSSSGSPADGASGGHTHPVAPASSSAAPLQQQHPPGDAAGSASAAAAAGHGSSSSVCALKRLYCSWNALGGDAGLEAVAKLFADSLQELAVNSSEWQQVAAAWTMPRCMHAAQTRDSLQWHRACQDTVSHERCHAFHEVLHDPAGLMNSSHGRCILSS
jgi:hypothetical protein